MLLLSSSLPYFKWSPFRCSLFLEHFEPSPSCHLSEEVNLFVQYLGSGDEWTRLSKGINCGIYSTVVFTLAERSVGQGSVAEGRAAEGRMVGVVARRSRT